MYITMTARFTGMYCSDNSNRPSPIHVLKGTRIVDLRTLPKYRPVGELSVVIEYELDYFKCLFLKNLA